MGTNIIENRQEKLKKQKLKKQIIIIAFIIFIFIGVWIGILIFNYDDYIDNQTKVKLSHLWACYDGCFYSICGEGVYSIDVNETGLCSQKNFEGCANVCYNKYNVTKNGK